MSANATDIVCISNPAREQGGANQGDVDVYVPGAGIATVLPGAGDACIPMGFGLVESEGAGLLADEQLEASREEACSLAGADGGTGLSGSARRNVFRFADRWSARTTWGGMNPPVSGDSVVIPANETVLLDVSPPRLELLVVMGELVFLDQSDLELIAKHIMVRGGAIRIGAPGMPHVHKAVITLYGDRRDYAIPMYGAKVLAVREGLLDLHGATPLLSKTRLALTVHGGDSEIVVHGDTSDWPVGGELLIAATDHWHDEAETRLIVAATVWRAKDGTSIRTTITLDRPLRSLHRAQDYWYKGRLYARPSTTQQLDSARTALLSANTALHANITTEGGTSSSTPVRASEGWHPVPVGDTHRRVPVSAEVALLSRNIVVRGDMPTSFDVQYGAQVHVLSPERLYGPRSVLVRMDGVEMRQVG